MPITFTKASNRVTINDNGVIYGVSGTVNVLPHPNEDCILVTRCCSPIAAISGQSDSLKFKVSDITTPTANDKFLMVTALQSIFS
jgi:hypothetical protein